MKYLLAILIISSSFLYAGPSDAKGEDSLGQTAEVYDAMDFSLDLAYYPSPTEALQMKKELRLSVGQRKTANRINERTLKETDSLRNEINSKKDDLNTLFATRTASDARIASLISDLAALKGQLALANLRARLEMREALKNEQVEKFAALQGKASGELVSEPPRRGPERGSETRPSETRPIE